MKAFVFLADGFEEVEAITPIDLLRRAGIEVTTVSISDTLAVTGAHQITLQADALFDEMNYSDASLLVLPGGMPGTNNLNAYEPLRALIVAHNEAHKPIGAICAAPLILGQLQILEHKKAVCYPSFEPELKGADVQFTPVQVADNIVTARGAGCATPFALALIELLCGSKKAQEIAESIIFNS